MPNTTGSQSQTEQFVQRWTGHGNEQQETRCFWIDLPQYVSGFNSALEDMWFQCLTATRRLTDALSPDARFLVEQKAAR
jgi:hypothetical protein